MHTALRNIHELIIPEMKGKINMNEHLERDNKMIDLYESMAEFYEVHDQPELVNQYSWPLELYDKLEEKNIEIEQLKEQLQEQEQYIEDWQIKSNEGVF